MIWPVAVVLAALNRAEAADYGAVALETGCTENPCRVRVGRRVIDTGGGEAMGGVRGGAWDVDTEEDGGLAF